MLYLRRKAFPKKSVHKGIIPSDIKINLPKEFNGLRVVINGMIFDVKPARIGGKVRNCHVNLPLRFYNKTVDVYFMEKDYNTLLKRFIKKVEESVKE